MDVGERLRRTLIRFEAGDAVLGVRDPVDRYRITNKLITRVKVRGINWSI